MQTPPGERWGEPLGPFCGSSSEAEAGISPLWSPFSAAACPLLPLGAASSVPAPCRRLLGNRALLDNYNCPWAPISLIRSGSASPSLQDYLLLGLDCMRWLCKDIFKERRDGKLCAFFTPPPPLLSSRGGERPREEREGPGLMARCLILLSSSAKKSLYSSFCLEKSPLPSTENPVFAHRTQIGSHSVFQQQLTEWAVVERDRLQREGEGEGRFVPPVFSCCLV